MMHRSIRRALLASTTAVAALSPAIAAVPAQVAQPGRATLDGSTPAWAQPARDHGAADASQPTEIKVYLPLPAGVVEAPRAAPLPETPARGGGELILVVDDEAVIREVTQKTLETFGYRVLTAEDGAQAISCYAEHRGRVAVVLTDMMMPVMDGSALARALRRLDPAVRIVAASGFDASGKATAAAHLGVKHFLAKPYSASVLLKTIRAAIAAAPENSTPGLS